MIHFHCYKSQYFEPIYRTGVPIFFIISGYFLYSNDRKQRLRKYVKSMKKIIKLIFFFNFAYFLLYWYKNGVEYLYDFNLNKIIRLIIYGDSISGHLWFLTSLFWTVGVLWLCEKMNLSRIFVYILSITYFIVGLLQGQYAFLFGLEDFSIQNYYLPWLVSSLPLIVMGMVIHNYAADLSKTILFKSKKGLYLFFIFCILGSYIEHRILSLTHHYTGHFMLSTFWLTIVFFLICINNPNMGKGTFLAKIGKDHSGNIYYWQFFPYILFVESFVDAFSLNEICLPIMCVVLLAWSYMTNYTVETIQKIRSRKCTLF